VLPIEFLPCKSFSLPVIEAACNHYLVSSDGLRNTVRRIAGVAPHFTTLHGWLGGIGERALDRIQLKNDKAAIGEPSLPPTSTLVAETAKRKDHDLLNRWNKMQRPIAPWKYKSLFRKEMLQSCLKLLLIAASLFEASSYPLTMWEEFLICEFNVPCWLFASKNLITPIQRIDFTNIMIMTDSTSGRDPP
jgi:hypothetical protein